MPHSEQEFVIDNEYTLSQITQRSLSDKNGFSSATVITRTFNFLAQQVTTHVRDTALGDSGGYSRGGAGGVSSTLTQQHFEEFRSEAEIIYMHKKLVELGGKPPAIAEVLRGLGKKNSGLSAAAKG